MSVAGWGSISDLHGSADRIARKHRRRRAADDRHIPIDRVERDRGVGRVVQGEPGHRVRIQHAARVVEQSRRPDHVPHQVQPRRSRRAQPIRQRHVAHGHVRLRLDRQSLHPRRPPLVRQHHRVNADAGQHSHDSGVGEPEGDRRWREREQPPKRRIARGRELLQRKRNGQVIASVDENRIRIPRVSQTHRPLDRLNGIRAADRHEVGAQRGGDPIRVNRKRHARRQHVDAIPAAMVGPERDPIDVRTRIITDDAGNQSRDRAGGELRGDVDGRPAGRVELIIDVQSRRATRAGDGNRPKDRGLDVPGAGDVDRRSASADIEVHRGARADARHVVDIRAAAALNRDPAKIGDCDRPGIVREARTRQTISLRGAVRRIIQQQRGLPFDRTVDGQ